MADYGVDPKILKHIDHNLQKLVDSLVPKKEESIAEPKRLTEEVPIRDILNAAKNGDTSVKDEFRAHLVEEALVETSPSLYRKLLSPEVE